MAAITFINSNSARSSDGNTVTSGAVSMSGANFCTISVSFAKSVVPTITDSTSATWNARTQYDTGSISNAVRIYYANLTGNASHTFTLTCTACFPSGEMLCFSGVKTSTPYDTENGTASTGVTSLQPGSITPSEDNTVVISGLSYSAASSPAIDSSFSTPVTADHRAAMNYGSSGAYKIQTTAAAVNPTWSSIASSDVAATQASFKSEPAGSGPASGSLSMMGMGK